MKNRILTPEVVQTPADVQTAIRQKLACVETYLAEILGGDRGLLSRVWKISGVSIRAFIAVNPQTVGEQAKCAGDLRPKLACVGTYLAEILGGDRVSKCSGGSGWSFFFHFFSFRQKLKYSSPLQDGHLLSSKCILFDSATEEVSVCGFPVPTSGIISTGFSSRRVTVLSGRLTEVNSTGRLSAQRNPNLSRCRLRFCRNLQWSRERLGFGEARANQAMEGGRRRSSTWKKQHGCSSTERHGWRGGMR